MARIGIGIIGAGRFAQTHLEAFRRDGRAEVVALCRRDPTALAAARERWGVPRGFTDYRDLLALDEIDAVSIVTPTDSHFEIAMAAIAAGKHVLCEKPLTLFAEESRLLLEAAERRGVIHAVNFNKRGATAVGSLRRYLDEGFVGEICHLNIWWGMSLQHDVRPEVGSWRFRPESGGGPIYELVHCFDFVRFLAGEVRRICSLAATAEPFRPFADVPGGLPVTVPDSAAHLLELESGATAVIHTSFVTRGTDANGRAEPRVEVSGTRGRIVTVDGIAGIGGGVGGIGGIGGGQRLQGISGGQGALVELETAPYPLPYEQFVDAIVADVTGAGAAEPLVETRFHEGYRAAQLVDAAQLSIRERRWVDL
jgi:predicted dehydrogenase